MKRVLAAMVACRSKADWTFVTALGLAVLVLCLVQGRAATQETASNSAEPVTLPTVFRAVDLNIGESTELQLPNGSNVRLKLVDVSETRDALCQAVREAKVRVEVNDASLTLTSATYHLQITFASMQIDCPITRGYIDAKSRQNVWALKKDARFRVWPAGSPWIQPGTFVYPAKQRWFANDTQMANEPVFVNGAEIPGAHSIYYHWGLDFGGAEGLVEVATATDGLVVTAGTNCLTAYTNSPAKPRYDVIYVLDGRGWYYRYSHLQRIDVQPGQRVRMGQQIGLLGKEGGSGGWSHLHFDITSRQPSGEWGIQDAYAYAWEAWRNENRPGVLAVARPHRVTRVGEKVILDGSLSWCSAGSIARYEWNFCDGPRKSGATVEHVYSQPGTYSEMLTVTDSRGEIGHDFAVVQVLGDASTNNLPPAIHAAFYPTTDIRAGDVLTFKVRSFRTQSGEETWDFGDGSTPIKVKSDGNRNVHGKDGYAVTEHRYTKPGRYIARVERTNERGEKAIARLYIPVGEKLAAQTRVGILGNQWLINGQITYPGTRAEGLLMNVRMVNATFEDRCKPEFEPEQNTDRF